MARIFFWEDTGAGWCRHPGKQEQGTRTRNKNKNRNKEQEQGTRNKEQEQEQEQGTRTRNKEQGTRNKNKEQGTRNKEQGTRNKKKKKNNNNNNRRLTQACPLFLVRHLFLMDPSWQPVTGAAQRRRGRRLRAAWRHEQQSIAQVLATFTHHSAQRQKTARAGEEGHDDKNNAPRRQKPPPPQAFFQLFDEEDAEWRCGRPAWPIQLFTVEHIAGVVPVVQILDIPVPQKGGRAGGFLGAPGHADTC